MSAVDRIAPSPVIGWPIVSYVKVVVVLLFFKSQTVE